MDQEDQKRKFDLAMQQTRRSLEAVETHRRNLIDNELILLYNSLDLKNLIDSLVNDQEVLFKYLCDLKAIKVKTAATNDQIKQIEDDLELRGAQIVELSSTQEDLDVKVKKLSESFKTIPELRTTVVHLINKLLETRNDFKTRLADAEERIKKLTDENLDLQKRKIKPETTPKEKLTKKRTHAIVETYDEAAPGEGTSKSEDNSKDPDFSPRSMATLQMKKLKLACACKTNCLKKFCVCKKAGNFCTNCDCINCLNVDNNTSNEVAEKKELPVDL